MQRVKKETHKTRRHYERAGGESLAKCNSNAKWRRACESVSQTVEEIKDTVKDP